MCFLSRCKATHASPVCFRDTLLRKSVQRQKNKVACTRTNALMPAAQFHLAVCGVSRFHVEGAHTVYMARTHFCMQSASVATLETTTRIHIVVRREFRLCELQWELLQRFNPKVSWPRRSSSEHANRCHSNDTANQVRTAQLTQPPQYNFQTVENNEWRKQKLLHMQGAARSLLLKQLTEEYDVSVGAA